MAVASGVAGASSVSSLLSGLTKTRMNQTGDKRARTTAEYLFGLDQEQREKLLRIYEEDLEAFGYSAEEYLMLRNATLS